MYCTSYIIASLIMVFSMATITASVKPDWPADTGIQSKAGIVMDMDSRAVLFAQNIHKQKVPASITKLLTAPVVIENTNDLDVPVIFSHDAMYNVELGAGNKFSLEEEDILSIRQCLRAMLLQSSNQLVNALTEYMAGSRQAFVGIMNQQIAELSRNENHSVNPSGLNDDTQRTAAYDMAVIVGVCFQGPTMLEIASTRTSTIPTTANSPSGRIFSIGYKTLLSDNSNYYPGAIADRTGQISRAGQAFVIYTRREGKGQVAVTLKSTQKTYCSDTKAVLDFCFTESKDVNIADNEIKYVTGGTPVTIAEETYDLSELSIGGGAVITIPNGAQFTDVDRALETDLPEDHPQEAATRLAYTYNERRVGDVWIYSSRVQAVNTTPSESGEDTSRESQPEKDGQNRKTGLKLPRTVLISGGAVLVPALIAGGGVFWSKRRQAAERERRRILREKRRQCLTDVGYMKGGFKRLLDGRKKQHDMR